MSDWAVIDDKRRKRRERGREKRRKGRTGGRSMTSRYPFVIYVTRMIWMMQWLWILNSFWIGKISQHGQRWGPRGGRAGLWTKVVGTISSQVIKSVIHNKESTIRHRHIPLHNPEKYLRSLMKSSTSPICSPYFNFWTKPDLAKMASKHNDLDPQTLTIGHQETMWIEAWLPCSPSLSHWVSHLPSWKVLLFLIHCLLYKV